MKTPFERQPDINDSEYAFNKGQYVSETEYDSLPVMEMIPLTEAESSYIDETVKTTEDVDPIPDDALIYPLVMVYSAYQKFENINEPEFGLEAGTIFKELEKPFYGKKVRQK